MIKISDAELEVMHIIWNKKIVTSFEIIEELSNKKWTANTIRTLIKRLLSKGAIEIHSKKGKTYYYKPVLNKEKYLNYQFNKLLNVIYRKNTEKLLLDLLSQNLITIEDIKWILSKKSA